MNHMFNKAAEFPKNHVAITPSDANQLPQPMIIYVLADGDVVAKDKNGTSITYTCVAGDILPVLVVQVMAATDATVIGLY